MFDPQQGFVNYVLGLLHLPLAHTTWLDGTWTAWAAILIADAWRNTPFIAIVLLAGLQVIPGDIYEAATDRRGERLADLPEADPAAAQARADGRADLPHAVRRS